MQNRVERVAFQVKTILMESLYNGIIRDPIIKEAFLTITRVEMSKDLKIARCYIVTSQFHKIDDVSLFKSLSKAASILRNIINKEITLKYSPKLVFFKDDWIEKQEKVENIIKSMQHKC